MKKSLTRLLALSAIGLLMLTACKKSGLLVTSNGGQPGALTASATTVVLNKANVGDLTTPAITFTFTQANYGFNAAITNTLQIDKVGDNWAKPTSVTLGINTLTQTYNTPDLNSLLLKMGLVGGTATQVNVRIVQSISASLTPTYSNVLTLTVTPFNLASYLYIVGGYQGWSPANADSLQSPTSNGIYTGVIPFKSGSGNNNFKIILNKLNYNGNIGWASTGTTLNPTSTYPAPTTVENTTSASSQGNLFCLSGVTDDAATQIFSNYITFNSITNVMSLTPTQWSVVGDASPGGWPNGSGTQSDTDMKFDNSTQTWNVTCALTATGTSAIKFRLNHDWTVNYGGSNGTLALGGANIVPAVSGTYTITLDLVHLTYTLVKH